MKLFEPLEKHYWYFVSPDLCLLHWSSTIYCSTVSKMFQSECFTFRSSLNSYISFNADFKSIKITPSDMEIWPRIWITSILKRNINFLPTLVVIQIIQIFNFYILNTIWIPWWTNMCNKTYLLNYDNICRWQL